MIQENVFKRLEFMLSLESIELSQYENFDKAFNELREKAAQRGLLTLEIGK